METNEEEYIAYRPDKYTQIIDNPKTEDESEFAYEKSLAKFKWDQFMNDYDSVAASDISFKRVKRDDEEVAPEDSPPAEEGGGGGDDSGGGGGGGGGGGSDEAGGIELHLTPIIGLTVFFGLMFIIGPLIVRKGPNRGIVQSSIMLAAFCMWIFWVTVYIGQMNPLMGPRLDNTTVAWMSVKLGDPVKPAAPPGGAE